MADRFFSAIFENVVETIEESKKKKTPVLPRTNTFISFALNLASNLKLLLSDSLEKIGFRKFM